MHADSEGPHSCVVQIWPYLLSLACAAGFVCNSTLQLYSCTLRTWLQSLGLHCWAHIHRETLPPQECMPVSPVGSGPRRRPWPHHVSASSSCYHHCLAWSLEVPLRILRAFAASMELPQHLPRTMLLLVPWTPEARDNKSSSLPWRPRATMHPTLGAHTLDPQSGHASGHPQPRAEVFPYQSRFIKSRRGDCFFKGTHASARLFP